MWSGTSVRVFQRIYVNTRIIVLSSTTLSAQALGVGHMCTIGITTVYPLLPKSEYKELLLAARNTKLAGCNDNA